MGKNFSYFLPQIQRERTGIEGKLLKNESKVHIYIITLVPSQR